jgi:hypothetical protein
LRLRPPRFRFVRGTNRTGVSAAAGELISFVFKTAFSVEFGVAAQMGAGEDIKGFLRGGSSKGVT